MVPAGLAGDVSLLKYEQVAADIRAQVANGMLAPGAVTTVYPPATPARSAGATPTADRAGYVLGARSSLGGRLSRSGGRA